MMRLPVLIILLQLLAGVWAGGYQGALERIFMYQAYVIDTKLNAENDQIMGWQCKGANFNDATKTCTGVWTRTAGHRGNTPLTYDRFVPTLGKAPGGRVWSVFDGGALDIEKSAKKTYDEFHIPQPGQNPNNAFVKNFGAHMFMRDTVEWNDCIKRTSQMVEKTYKAKERTLTDEQKKLFTDFDKTTALVVNARIGDHGPHLIQMAQSKLQPDGITVRTKSVGTNPIAGGATWDTVDWKETIKQAEDAGIVDAKNKVKLAAKDVYKYKAPTTTTPRPDNSARLHKQVIDSYIRAQERKSNCGRP